MFSLQWLLLCSTALASVFDRMFEDPLCEGSRVWSRYRELLSDPSLPLHDKTVASQEFLYNLAVHGKTLLDDEYPCLLGVIANTYYRLVAEGLPIMELLDLYVNGLVNSGTGNAYYTVFDKPEWGVTEDDFSALRRSILLSLRKARQGLSESTVLEGPLASHLRQQIADYEARRREVIDANLEDLLRPYWEPTPTEVLVVPTSESRGLAGVKVFVYSDGSDGLRWLTSGTEFCRHNQWGMDVTLHDFFTTSAYSTLSPDDADFFLVPGWPACHYYMRLPDDCQNRTTEAYEDAVANLPYFKHTRGRDHIFPIYFSDFFQGFRTQIPESSILNPETEIAWERSLDDFPSHERRNAFDVYKDIAIPPLLEPSRILPFALSARAITDREILASFAGKAWSDITEVYAIRRQMKEVFADRNDSVILVEESMRDLLSQDDMANLMGNSIFCLIPRGRVAWTVRLYEALWAECIPVILSDYLELPFEQLFDVTKATIKWPQDEIHTLYDYLKSVSNETLQQYRAAGQALRCWYTYPPGDLYWLVNRSEQDSLQLLESLCPNLSSSRNAMVAVAQILSRRKRATRSGRRTFWPHNHS